MCTSRHPSEHAAGEHQDCCLSDSDEIVKVPPTADAERSRHHFDHVHLSRNRDAGIEGRDSHDPPVKTGHKRSDGEGCTQRRIAKDKSRASERNQCSLRNGGKALHERHKREDLKNRSNRLPTLAQHDPDEVWSNCEESEHGGGDRRTNHAAYP